MFSSKFALIAGVLMIVSLMLRAFAGNLVMILFSSASLVSIFLLLQERDTFALLVFVVGVVLGALAYYIGRTKNIKGDSDEN